MGHVTIDMWLAGVCAYETYPLADGAMIKYQMLDY